jgi:hypothetical protein
MRTGLIGLLFNTPANKKRNQQAGIATQNEN